MMDTTLADAAREIQVGRKLDALEIYRSMLTSTGPATPDDAAALAEALQTLGLTPGDFTADQRAIALVDQHQQAIADAEDRCPERDRRRSGRSAAMAEARAVRRDLMAEFRAQLAREQQLAADEHVDVKAGEAADQETDRLRREVNLLRKNHPRFFGG